MNNLNLLSIFLPIRKHHHHNLFCQVTFVFQQCTHQSKIRSLSVWWLWSTKLCQKVCLASSLVSRDSFIDTSVIDNKIVLYHQSSNLSPLILQPIGTIYDATIFYFLASSDQQAPTREAATSWEWLILLLEYSLFFLGNGIQICNHLSNFQLFSYCSAIYFSRAVHIKKERKFTHTHTHTLNMQIILDPKNCNKTKQPLLTGKI